MTDFEDWKAVAASNNDPAPDGWPEGMNRTDVNDSAREGMGAARRDWDGTATGGGEWRDPVKDETIAQVSATQVRVLAFDATGFFPVGRKVKISHSSSADSYAFVTAVVFSTDTTITVGDFDDANEISADANKVQFFNAFGGGFGILSGAFETAGGVYFEIPSAFTGAAINAAIATAKGNGGVVLLAAGTYAIETQILITGDVQIWGRGTDRTFLTLDDTIDEDVIDIAANSTDVILRDFTVDGNESNQNIGNALTLANGCRRITIERVRITDIRERGIFIDPGSTSVRDVTISACIIEKTGRNGIEIVDPDGLSDRIFIRGCTILDPGSVGVLALGSNGIRFNGRVTISDCFIQMNQASSSHGGSGIIAVRPDPGASPSSGGEHSTIVGCRVEGTSNLVRGFTLEGQNLVMSGCYVKMTSTAAFVLEIDGRGAGVEQAKDIIVSGCYFEGGDKATFTSDGVRVKVTGCTFDNQNTEGIEINGNDSVISGNTFRDGTTGVAIRSGATDNIIIGNDFQDHTTGINANSGAVDTQINGNSFVACTTGISITSGAVTSVVTGNSFSTCSTDISDAGTNTRVQWNDGAADQKQVTKETNQTPGAAEVDIVSLTGITLPGLGGNGQRVFRVGGVLHFSAGAASFEWAIRIYVGPDGDLNDTEIFRMDYDTAGGDIDWPSTIVPFEFVPNAGDKVGFTSDEISGIGSVTIEGSATVPSIMYIEKVREK